VDSFQLTYKAISPILSMQQSEFCLEVNVKHLRSKMGWEIVEEEWPDFKRILEEPGGHEGNDR
jgi:hypothetical protein